VIWRIVFRPRLRASHSTRMRCTATSQRRHPAVKGQGLIVNPCRRRDVRGKPDLAARCNRIQTDPMTHVSLLFGVCCVFGGGGAVYLGLKRSCAPKG